MIKAIFLAPLALASTLLGSAYAFADVDVVNNISSDSSTTLTVNDQTVALGASQVMGLNIFDGDARVNFCDKDNNCKKFKIQDTHESCESASWYYLINPQSWYIDLYVNDNQIGHLCTVMYPNGFGDLIVHLKFQFEQIDGDHTYEASFEDMLGDEKQTFVW